MDWFIRISFVVFRWFYPHVPGLQGIEDKSWSGNLVTDFDKPWTEWRIPLSIFVLLADLFLKNDWTHSCDSVKSNRWISRFTNEICWQGFIFSMDVRARFIRRSRASFHQLRWCYDLSAAILPALAFNMYSGGDSFHFSKVYIPSRMSKLRLATLASSTYNYRCLSHRCGLLQCINPGENLL